MDIRIAEHLDLEVVCALRIEFMAEFGGVDPGTVPDRFAEAIHLLRSGMRYHATRPSGATTAPQLSCRSEDQVTPHGCFRPVQM